jgi:hypothetical protein
MTSFESAGCRHRFAMPVRRCRARHRADQRFHGAIIGCFLIEINLLICNALIH